jgi:hypothetical protein
MWIAGIHLEPKELLDRIWQMLPLDGTPARFREAFGIVDALYTVGLLEATEAFNWKKKIISQCPGHCNQRWCSYCGDLPPDENRSELWNEKNWKELHVDSLEAGKSLKLGSGDPGKSG